MACPRNTTPEGRAAHVAHHKFDRAMGASSKARSERAEVRRLIMEGRLSAESLVRGNEAEWEIIAKRMKLRIILHACVGIGPVTVEEFFLILGVPRETRLENLTWESRKQAADLLAETLAHAPRVETPKFNQTGGS